jgi:5-methylcytosine-specific restriction endonuclease McrA
LAKQQKWGFLRALDDPLLPEEDRARFFALRLLNMVYQAETDEQFPDPLNFEAELANLRASFVCVNCGKEVDRPATLYCSQHCQQLVVTVRYVRKAIVENRIKKLDIQQAIGTRLLMLHAGGEYPAKERSLSTAQRRAIFERDAYRCQICGKEATQVDHIAGSSSDPSNLRATCADCNKGEAFNNARPATAEDEEVTQKMYRGMSVRIAAPVALQACDDYVRWNGLQGSLCGARRKHINEVERIHAADEELVNGTEFWDPEFEYYLWCTMQRDD